MANILVADDSTVTRAWLEKLLPAMGHAVAGMAPCGMEAVRLAAALRPDLVLMDVCMPGEMDGLSAGDRIGATLRIPVVYMTAHTDEAILGRIMDAAPLGFVIKPIQAAQLRLTLEITLRTTAEKALAEANARLERLLLEDRLRRDLENADAASRAKTEFLARVSHELRTPLNSILGMCEVLAEAGLDPAHQGCIETIGQSGETLLRLIDDVLDISRLDSGRLPLRNMSFSPEAALRETAAAITPMAQKKGLRVHVRVQPGLPEAMRGDPSALRRVLGNLADNAVKFTDRGEVELIVEPAPSGSNANRLFFRVRDTGVGIDPKDQRTVFEPFAHPPGSNRPRSGAGLGLAVATRLAGLMGGEILLESRPGLGSLFTFTVPLEPLEEPSPGVPVPPPEAADNAGATTTPFSASPAAAGPGPGPRRILVAEDNQGNRDVISLYLEGSPFATDMAADGAAAVALFRPGAYAAVLMDIDMPVMDGFTATREMRRLEAAADVPQTPIIALTAHDLPEFRRLMIEAGCTDFLVKPIRKARLLEALPHPAPEQPAAFIEIAAGHGEPPPEVLRLLPAFFSIQIRNLDKMRHALARNDLDILRIMGHGLRGSALTYGMAAMAELGVEIERAAKAGDTAVMDGLLDRLGETIAREAERDRTSV
ncbi:response regulator [Desulfolutivibrio sulfoxidireducens]|uniref:response regulator n=1 Tax=Desulfolutivibrio sulfoxidireducens TaxID=2773299 RepID=UPI00159D8959|nr:response regulator [Desulfolutivibrio sulfoxidireducens]